MTESFEAPKFDIEDLLNQDKIELIRLGFIPMHNAVNGTIFWCLRTEWFKRNEVPLNLILHSYNSAEAVDIAEVTKLIQEDEDPNPLVFSPYGFTQQLYCIEIKPTLNVVASSEPRNWLKGSIGSEDAVKSTVCTKEAWVGTKLATERKLASLEGEPIDARAISAGILEWTTPVFISEYVDPKELKKLYLGSWGADDEELS